MSANYTTSIIMGGQKIIPSDIFTINTSEYILMNISTDAQGENTLEIMGLSGPNMAESFSVGQEIFSTFSPHTFEEEILKYKQY